MKKLFRFLKTATVDVVLIVAAYFWLVKGNVNVGYLVQSWVWLFFGLIFFVFFTYKGINDKQHIDLYINGRSTPSILRNMVEVIFNGILIYHGVFILSTARIISYLIMESIFMRSAEDGERLYKEQQNNEK